MKHTPEGKCVGCWSSIVYNHCPVHGDVKHEATEGWLKRFEETERHDSRPTYHWVKDFIRKELAQAKQEGIVQAVEAIENMDDVITIFTKKGTTSIMIWDWNILKSKLLGKTEKEEKV